MYICTLALFVKKERVNKIPIDWGLDAIVTDWPKGNGHRQLVRKGTGKGIG